MNGEWVMYALPWVSCGFSVNAESGTVTGGWTIFSGWLCFAVIAALSLLFAAMAGREEFLRKRRLNERKKADGVIESGAENTTTPKNDWSAFDRRGYARAHSITVADPIGAASEVLPKRTKKSAFDNKMRIIHSEWRKTLRAVNAVYGSKKLFWAAMPSLFLTVIACVPVFAGLFK